MLDYHCNEGFVRIFTVVALTHIEVLHRFYNLTHQVVRELSSTNTSIAGVKGVFYSQFRPLGCVSSDAMSSFNSQSTDSSLF